MFDVNVWFLIPKEVFAPALNFQEGMAMLVPQRCVTETFQWGSNTGVAQFIIFPGLQNKREVNKIILKKISTQLISKFI